MQQGGGCGKKRPSEKGFGRIKTGKTEKRLVIPIHADFPAAAFPPPWGRVRERAANRRFA